MPKVSARIAREKINPFIENVLKERAKNESVSFDSLVERLGEDPVFASEVMSVAMSNFFATEEGEIVFQELLSQAKGKAGHE